MSEERLRISVVGSGYVGTTLAASLAAAGHRVTATDIDKRVVVALDAGEAYVHEPGLNELVSATAGERLTATTEYDGLAGTDLTLLCVQTPSRNGGIDIGPLETAARMTGEALVGPDAPADALPEGCVRGTRDGETATPHARC